MPERDGVDVVRAATATATWVPQARRRWVLHDEDGRGRGWVERVGRGLRVAEAEVDGTAIALRSSGLATRRLEATLVDGRTTTLQANALSWSGTVGLTDGTRLPLTRHLGRAAGFTIGDPAAPLVAMTTRRREVVMHFAPAIAASDPGVLPLGVLLHLHHLRATSAA